MPSVIETVQEGVILIGTAHVSPTSVAEVEDAIRRLRPAQVLVELDASRLKALRDPEGWQNTDIIQVLRQKKQHLFLLQLYLSAMQSSMGRETGVAPGTELLRAVEVAEEVGAEVVLIDREVAVTLKRGFGAMGGWARLRLFWNVWMQVFTPGNRDALNVEKLLEHDAITEMTEQFARFAPVIKVALIDERDTYMASHIHERSAQGTLVAVVGAGHVAGIRRHLGSPATSLPPRETLLELPRKRVTPGKVVGYVILLAIVGGLAYLFLNGQVQHLKSSLLAYVLFTGLGAAAGAALALGHPLSVLTAAVAAPTKILHPVLASGWFAGLVEAKLRTPKVADFQAIKHIETIGEFWRNGVVRILLVTALTNLGAIVGNVLTGLYIFRALGAGP